MYAYVCVCVRPCALGHAQLSVTRWTIACQPPLSTEFFKQGNGGRLSFLPPVELPDPEVKPKSLVSPARRSGFFTTVPPGKWK